MKRIVLLTVVSLFAGIVSCQKSEVEAVVVAGPKIGISATQQNFSLADDGLSSSGAATRVAETTFQPSDSIGLYVHQAATVGVSGNHSANVCYVYGGGQWTAADALSGELTPTSTYYVTSYHPYKRGIANPTAIAHSVEYDQSAAYVAAKAGALERSDFIITSAPQKITNLDSSPQVALGFKHLMNKLVVKFTIPQSLDGVAVVGVKSVTLKSVMRSCVVNLATAAVSGAADSGDVIPRLSAGDGTPGMSVSYEAILAPQTIKGADRSLPLVEIVCEMAGSVTRSLNYTIPATQSIALASGQKYTLNLTSIAEVAFLNEINLLDGLAKQALPLKIQVPKDNDWTLTSGESWLELSTTAANGYAASITGKGKGEGVDQIVYVKVAANNAPSSGATWSPRQAKITLATSTASAYYMAVQNYYRFGVATAALNLTAVQQVPSVGGFTANQVWNALSNGAWALLSSSATYGAGDPKATFGPVVGSLAANQLYYQVAVNNTNAARSTTVVYTPTTVGSLPISVAVNQAAPALAAGVIETTLASVTGQPATQYQVTGKAVTVGSGIKWKLTTTEADLTIVPLAEQSASVSNISLTLKANNTADARTVTYTLNYGAMDGVLKTSYTIVQVAPSIAVSATELEVSKDAGAAVKLFTVTAPVGIKWKILSVTPETGTNKDMKLALNLATNTEKVGDGAAFQVTGSYEVSAQAFARKTTVVVAFAAYGSTQQKSFVITQKAAAPANAILVNGVWWATGNLVANGANGCKIGAPGDGGLYFQYGGLVGYKGGASGDGTGVVNAAKHPNGVWWNGAASYSTTDISVTPTGYTSSKTTWPYFDNVNTGGFGYYYYNSFVTKYADFQSQANSTNIPQGIGDPCKHYLGGDWRLPTYIELSAITGNTTEGAWVPWATAGVTGRWEKTGPQSSIGVWFGPNSRTGTPTAATDLFIPASGHRNYNSGAFYWVGVVGYAWSSSVVDSYSGFTLDIHESNGVYPRRWNYRAHAFPVRCVSAS